MTRMGATGSGYEIARPTGLCAATGEPIEPGSAYMATLCERVEDDGFDRLDFSLAVWEGGRHPERLYCCWKTVMPQPNAKRRTFVDDEVLLNLFDRLADDQQDQRIAYRFVLALILLRKRLLRLDSTRRDGERSIMEMSRRGDSPEPPPVEVVDPKLTDDQVREVSDQLGEILRGEL